MTPRMWLVALLLTPLAGLAWLVGELVATYRRNFR